MNLPNKNPLVTFFLLFLSLVCTAAQEQRPPPPQTLGTPPPGLPIDNGLIVLFIVALIYGIYRTLKFSRNN